jgi:hypothetical protein
MCVLHTIITIIITKMLNHTCKRCFISHLMIHLFIGNGLLRDRRRQRGPWFCFYTSHNPKSCAPPVPPPPRGWSPVVCMRDKWLNIHYIYILVGTCSVEVFHLPLTTLCWLRTTSNTLYCRLKSTFFGCRNTQTNKNEVTLLSQLILLFYYSDKGITALWASYSFTGPISHTGSLCEGAR